MAATWPFTYGSSGWATWADTWVSSAERQKQCTRLEREREAAKHGAPSDDAVFCQVRDDGAPLSMVMRYYEDAPTYAWVRTGVTAGPVRCLPGAFARAALTRQRAAGSSRR
jgi:hypothetical protein